MIDIPTLPRHHQRRPQPQSYRGRRSRRPHRRRIAKARRRAGRQRLHPDAQRHRLHRGGLCRDAARRLCRAGQLAFQAGGNQLHPQGFRNAGPDRPCRHAASVARRHSRRGHRAQRADAAGNSRPITRSIRRISATPDFATDFEPWLQAQPPYDGPALPQPQNMIYTSGTTGHPKGVRRNAPTPAQTANAEAHAGDDLRPEARRAGAVAGPAVPFRAELVRPARRPSRRRAGADAAVRSRGIFAAGPGPEDRHHLHGADHVHPADEAAGSGARQIRRLFAAARHPRRRALSGRRQARDDRMVGAGDL